MRYIALASDYDATLARAGRVSSATLTALERFVASGRKLVLVTGRELEDLFSVFSRCDLFERIVAENGALLHHPASRQTRRLAAPPPEKFIERLRRAGVPISVGRTIVSTHAPYENAVLDVIRELGLELQLIFNKGAVMVLPAGTNKASGLAAALREMGVSPHNVVGVGDAENDHAFLDFCGCAVAVANALETLKEKADFVTTGTEGAGVSELADEIVTSDLCEREDQLVRHRLLLGTRDDGGQIYFPFAAANLLLAGAPAAARSPMAGRIARAFYEHGYQFCFIDPRGDHVNLDEAVALGTAKRAPAVDEVLGLLRDPRENAIVNLAAVARSRRPQYMAELLARIEDLRARKARPHWLIINNAEEVLPASQTHDRALFDRLHGVLYITGRPMQMAPAALANIGDILANGDRPDKILRELARELQWPPYASEAIELNGGEVVFWSPRKTSGPFRLKLTAGASAEENPPAMAPNAGPKPSDDLIDV